MRWGIYILTVAALVVLLHGMLRDLPTVAAVFFFLLFLPFSYALGVSFAFAFSMHRKRSGLNLIISLTILLAASSSWIAYFPPDLRPTLTVVIPDDYEGNVYYFRPDGGEVQLTADEYGCIYIPPNVSEGKRFELYYGDEEIQEAQLASKIAMYTAEIGEDKRMKRKVPFASFAVNGTREGVVISKAKAPLESFYVLMQKGVLDQRISAATK